MNVILLNFLIAIVSQSYESVMERQIIHVYNQKVWLNYTYYSYSKLVHTYMPKFLYPISRFVIPVMEDTWGIFIVSTSSTEREAEENQWKGFVSSIKKCVVEQTKKVIMQVGQTSERLEAMEKHGLKVD